MAAFIAWLKSLGDTTPGQIVEAAVYAAMLLAVLAMFTGNGAFIYEGF